MKGFFIYSYMEMFIFNNILLRYLALLFIGFANGVPIPLSGSVLSIWLVESGFDRTTIGLFALLAIPFSFKILWKPIVDHFSFPLFSDQPRKGWLLFSLCGISAVFLCISFIDPSISPWELAACFCVLSFFTGCLYIVGLSYELESLDEKLYSMGSACAVTGYRLGLLFAGAGALYFSAVWDWSWMFRLMAGLLLLGGIMILMQPEPYKSKEVLAARKNQLSLYNSSMQLFLHEILLQPCRAFFKNSHWKAILFLLITFKLGDQVVKSMEGPFYLSLGYSKTTLATASKIWGMAASISGAFLAGWYLKGKEPFLALAKAGFIHSCSLICYYVLAISGKSLIGLYMTVAIENFTGGIAMTAFIHFLWRVSDKRHAAIQYALLWSVFSFKGDILASIGGILASWMAWDIFFLVVATGGFVLSFAVLSLPLPVPKDQSI